MFYELDDWWDQPLGPMQAAALMYEARIRAYLTQAEIAERMKISQSTISRWEQCERQPAFLDVMRVIEAAGFQLDVTLHSTEQQDRRGSLIIRQILERDAAAGIPARQRRFKTSRTRRYVPYDGSRKGPHIDHERMWFVIRPGRQPRRCGGR